MDISLADRKLIQNEAIQRLENSHVKRSLEPILGSDTEISFRCECSDLDCHAHIKLTTTQFDEYHYKGRRFVIKPNHEIVASEKIVAITTEYLIVEKYQDPLKLSEDYKKN